MRKQRSSQGNEEMARKLLKADEKAIQKQLAKGEPLKFHQRQAIRAALSGVEQTYADNYNSLAIALGVSRQLISWHKFKPGAPEPRQDGRHSVAEWRTYLNRAGRLNIAGEATSNAQSVNSDIAVENAICVMFLHQSDALPGALSRALSEASITLTQAQQDALCFMLWLSLASIADTELTERGLDGVFDAEEGAVEYPAEIVKLCNRIFPDAPLNPN